MYRNSSRVAPITPEMIVLIMTTHIGDVTEAVHDSSHVSPYRVCEIEVCEIEVCSFWGRRSCVVVVTMRLVVN